MFDLTLSLPRLSTVVMEKNIVSLSRSALQMRGVAAGSVDWQRNRSFIKKRYAVIPDPAAEFQLKIKALRNRDDAVVLSGVMVTVPV